LREELERANQALEERKLIERAKGILMKERGVDESDAYGLLRTAAMNENRRIVDVARDVVSTAGLMK
jgi:response regulator NasT